MDLLQINGSSLIFSEVSYIKCIHNIFVLHYKIVTYTYETEA